MRLQGGVSLISRPPAFSTDGKLLLVCTGSTVSIFSVATGLQVNELEGHTGLVTSLSVVEYTEAAKSIVNHVWTSSLDGTARFWNFNTGSMIKTVDVGKPIFSMVFMDLHIISWNVNGMHFTSSSGSRKLRLRREITTHVSRPVDILLVQEHKLSYAHTQRCGKLLPGGSHTFWEPAVGDHLSSGGVCISVGSRWLPRVIDHGTLVAGRATV
ncbi:hypothetical protein L7F22_023560 [Adiantum nelumboides]|nr:hypothetical protein [Adiantum nelumboides]